MKTLSKLAQWLNIAPAKVSPPQKYMASERFSFGGESQLWSPSGYVDMEDEIAQNRIMVYGPFASAQRYAWEFPFDGRQNGDETALESYQWGWIPTETQVASAVALQNMGNHRGEVPYTQNDPLQNQLLQAIYRSANQFWQETRNTNGTGWGY